MFPVQHMAVGSKKINNVAHPEDTSEQDHSSFQLRRNCLHSCCASFCYKNWVECT